MSGCGKTLSLAKPWKQRSLHQHFKDNSLPSVYHPTIYNSWRFSLFPGWLDNQHSECSRLCLVSLDPYPHDHVHCAYTCIDLRPKNCLRTKIVMCLRKWIGIHENPCWNKSFNLKSAIILFFLLYILKGDMLPISIYGSLPSCSLESIDPSFTHTDILYNDIYFTAWSTECLCCVVERASD